MTPTFADLAKAQYILLTTFTKDGRPKPTPIWAAVDQDRLLVITVGDSWKVKRIRKTPRVTLATCTMGGRATSEAVEGTAAVLFASPLFRHLTTLNLSHVKMSDTSVKSLLASAELTKLVHLDLRDSVGRPLKAALKKRWPFVLV